MLEGRWNRRQRQRRPRQGPPPPAPLGTFPELSRDGYGYGCAEVRVCASNQVFDEVEKIAPPSEVCDVQYIIYECINQLAVETGRVAPRHRSIVVSRRTLLARLPPFCQKKGVLVVSEFTKKRFYTPNQEILSTTCKYMLLFAHKFF